MKDYNWKQVFFSDKVRFEFHNDWRIKIWQKSRERHHLFCVDQKFNSRQSIMFWCCITYDSTGSLNECSNTMNSNECIDVLGNANIKLLVDHSWSILHFLGNILKDSWQELILKLFHVFLAKILKRVIIKCVK